MRAREESRVPFGSHEELKKVPWESALSEFFWLPNRCRETYSSVGSATVLRSLRKLAVMSRAAGLMPASYLARSAELSCKALGERGGGGTKASMHWSCDFP